MNNLFRQTRFSGFGQRKKEESGSGWDQSISPQQTQSSKDKKKEQGWTNWFRRQFSVQMSRDYDPNNGDEHAIAVAAAAYAIISLGESRSPDQKQRKEEPGISAITTRRKKEDRTIAFSEPDRGSNRFSDGSSKSSENPDTKVPVTAAPDIKKPEKALPPAPSVKKPPSSVDKQPVGSLKQSGEIVKHGHGTSKPDLPTSAKPAETPSSVDKQPVGSFKQSSVSLKHGDGTSKPDLPTSAKPAQTPSSVDKQAVGSFKQSSASFKQGNGTSKPDLPTSAKPAHAPSSVDKKPSGSLKPGSLTSKPNLPTTAKPAPPPAEPRRPMGPGTEKSQADIWEESALARITERYDKQKTIILDWEDKKKKKAKRRLDKHERELEGKRAKAMKRYHSEMHNVDQTAGGARAKAEEKKKNDVFKVKEKANIFRRTGKVPNSGFCF